MTAESQITAGKIPGEVVTRTDTGIRVRKPNLMKQWRMRQGLPPSPPTKPQPEPPKPQFGKLPTVADDPDYQAAFKVFEQASSKRTSLQVQLERAEADLREASVRYELGECNEQELERAEQRADRLRKRGYRTLIAAEDEALRRLHAAHAAAVEKIAPEWRTEESKIVHEWSRALERLEHLRTRHAALKREWDQAGQFSAMPWDPAGPPDQRGRLQGKHGIGIVKLTMTAAIDAWKATVQRLGYRV